MDFFLFICKNFCFISLRIVRLLVIITKNTLEKAVTRMSLVVLDIECIENKILKNIGNH